MSEPSTVIDNIGRLITNDSQFEVGATGELRDAWLVMVGGQIELVGTGPAPSAARKIANLHSSVCIRFLAAE